VAGRVEENPEGGARLGLRFSGSQSDGLCLAFVQVLHHEVHMHLLWHGLPGPLGPLVVLHLLEGDAVAAVVGADFGPVAVDLCVPAQQGAVKRCECPGVGAVDDDTWEARDSQSGMLPPPCEIFSKQGVLDTCDCGVYD
jgi:hypothetical protein